MFQWNPPSLPPTHTHTHVREADLVPLHHVQPDSIFYSISLKVHLRLSFVCVDFLSFFLTLPFGDPVDVNVTAHWEVVVFADC